jgi:hypothetical protein
MPCMKRTSAGERGGTLALVEGGSVRVGWPGAPGCTTTGVIGPACCAQTGSENKPARVLPAISPLCHAETFISDRSLRILLACKVLIDVEWSSIEVAHLITKTAPGSLPAIPLNYISVFRTGRHTSDAFAMLRVDCGVTPYNSDHENGKIQLLVLKTRT